MKHAPLHLIMPSILNTPANEIPIHFFRLPIAQQEILLVNIHTNPMLYKRIIASALYHDDPIFPQAICYSTDGPLSFSSTHDPPACSPPRPPPHMQPLEKPLRRNSMISY